MALVKAITQHGDSAGINLVAVIDGVANDMRHLSQGGRRFVYRYWLPPVAE
jgi:hypothetical protein